MAKSNYEIEFHPEAIRETREAIEWYRQRDADVASEFRALRLAGIAYRHVHSQIPLMKKEEYSSMGPGTPTATRVKLVATESTTVIPLFSSFDFQ